jgi:hypothetical protein
MRRRGHADDGADIAPSSKAAKTGASGKRRERQVPASLLDSELAQVLRDGQEAFVAAPSAEGEVPLREAQLFEALALVRSNAGLRTLGVDTTVPLTASAASALGETRVEALKLVGLSLSGAPAATALARAVSTNAALRSLAILETDVDGAWCLFDPSTSAFAANVRQRRAAHELPPLRIEQVDDGAGGSEDAAAAAARDADGVHDDGVSGDDVEGEKEEEDEEEEGEEDDDDEDCVECDGRDGRGRGAIACRRKLTGNDVVYTSSLGRDYCANCHAKLGRSDLRQTTADARLREVS